MNLPKTFDIRAVQIGRRINLRKFPTESALAVSPLLFTQGPGLVGLFRYGVVVFINIPLLEQQHLIDQTLSSYLVEPVENGEEESTTVTIEPDQDERVYDETIFLRDSSTAKMQILAEVIARSVLLAGYESRINRSFDLIEPFAEHLASNRGPRTSRQLMQTIGTALVCEHDMVGRAEVTEKPDYVTLERLYLLLEDEFELQERDSALVRKINLVSRTAQTSLELLHAKRSLRVEWYIVILIIVEILLTLFDLFVRNH
jgi:uncharacterized Rmd1/YagE family protein